MKTTKPGVTVALKSPSVFRSVSFSAYTFFYLQFSLSCPLPLRCSYRRPPFQFFSFLASHVGPLSLHCCHSVSEQVESITEPQQPCSPSTTSSLIERINEWSACEMIWCHGSCSAVCEGGKLGERLYDQSCITNFALPQRQSKKFMSLPAFTCLLITSKVEERHRSTLQHSVLHHCFPDSDCFQGPLAIQDDFHVLSTLWTSPHSVAFIGCILTSALSVYTVGLKCLMCFSLSTPTSFFFFFFNRWNLLSPRQHLRPSTSWPQ